MLEWAGKHFDTSVLLHSGNDRRDRYGRFGQIYALGVDSECRDKGKNAFAQFKAFSDTHQDWLFGYFTYDLKNQTEALTSSNFDGISMPAMHFFRPVVLIVEEKEVWKIGCLPGYGWLSDPEQVLNSLKSISQNQIIAPRDLLIRDRVGRDAYLKTVSCIKDHIQKGDIYEMNYCIEFFAEKAHIDPLSIWNQFHAKSPAPFSAYYSHEGNYLMCTSPERFLAKRGNKLISQPIKGTIGRGTDQAEDKRKMDQLFHDEKERSENVMIVDLVRNDLSRTAQRGSVKVEELFGIYPFRQVHQMISTISSELHQGYHFAEAIQKAFPMGSMTGAPKIRAMQLIEAYEDTKRGLYSGSIGYVDPEKNFDFNVVIRSILYNSKNSYLSFMAGSAITAGSVPEMEYEECLLKAKAMKEVLSL